MGRCRNRNRNKVNSVASHRANEHTLRRQFDRRVTEAERLSHQRRATLTQDIQDLRRELEQTNAIRDGGSIHHAQRVERRVAQMEKELLQCNDSGRVLQARSDALHNFSNLATLVFANNILGKQQEVFPDNADRCPGCTQPFRFDSIESVNVCDTCNRVVPVLFSVDDNSADTLILRAAVSGTAIVSDDTSTRSSFVT